MKLSKGFVGMQFRYKKLKLTKGAFLWGDPSSDQWSKICLDHGASKEPASVFLWDDPSSEQWSKICLDHGALKEPAIPWPEWIRRFFWCTMTQTDLGSLCRTRIIPKECTRRFLRCTMIQTGLESLIRTRITPKERTLILFQEIYFYIFVYMLHIIISVYLVHAS